MAVPAHDSRDHEFALKYGIPVCWVVKPDDNHYNSLQESYSGDGIIINSSNPESGLVINGLPSKEAAFKVIEWAESTGHGKKKVLGFLIDLAMLVWKYFFIYYNFGSFLSPSFGLGELQITRLAFCKAKILGGAIPSDFSR